MHLYTILLIVEEQDLPQKRQFIIHVFLKRLRYIFSHSIFIQINIFFVELINKKPPIACLNDKLYLIIFYFLQAL